MNFTLLQMNPEPYDFSQSRLPPPPPTPTAHPRYHNSSLNYCNGPRLVFLILFLFPSCNSPKASHLTLRKSQVSSTSKIPTGSALLWLIPHLPTPGYTLYPSVSFLFSSTIKFYYNFLKPQDLRALRVGNFVTYICYSVLFRTLLHQLCIKLPRREPIRQVIFKLPQKRLLMISVFIFPCYYNKLPQTYSLK